MYKAIIDYLKKHRHLRSLRLLIFAVILLMGLIISGVICRVAVKEYRKSATETKAEEIESQLSTLAANMVYYGYFTSEDSSAINLEISGLTSVFDGRILVINSGYKVVKDTYGILSERYVISPDVISCFEYGDVVNINSGKKYMDVLVPIYDGQTSIGTGKTIGIIKATVSLESVDYGAVSLIGKIGIAESIIVVVMLGFSFILSALITSPIVKLTGTVERVASFEEGDINLVGYQETEGIIRAFNAQRNRLKTLDDSRQEFVSDVSHELKTPIASMKVLADSLLIQEDAPIEMYKDFMLDIVEEVDRENKIITDLLELVHMDKGKEGLNVTSVNCNDMIELVIKRLSPIASQGNVEIVFESEREVFAEIDEVKMTLAITNLVENAIKYNKNPGMVRIFLDADHQSMTIEISDSGIGIPEDSISHIYERFYRADKSHSKEIGGTGLGLPITRKIVLLHRGSINVSSKKGEGTSFMLKIPLVYIK